MRCKINLHFNSIEHTNVDNELLEFLYSTQGHIIHSIPWHNNRSNEIIIKSPTYLSPNNKFEHKIRNDVYPYNLSAYIINETLQNYIVLKVTSKNE